MSEKELFGNSEQLDNISRRVAINAICEDGTQLDHTLVTKPRTGGNRKRGDDMGSGSPWVF